MAAQPPVPARWYFEIYGCEHGGVLSCLPGRSLSRRCGLRLSDWHAVRDVLSLAGKAPAEEVILIRCTKLTHHLYKKSDHNSIIQPSFTRRLKSARFTGPS